MSSYEVTNMSWQPKYSKSHTFINYTCKIKYLAITSGILVSLGVSPLHVITHFECLILCGLNTDRVTLHMAKLDGGGVCVRAVTFLLS